VLDGAQRPRRCRDLGAKRGRIGASKLFVIYFSRHTWARYYCICAFCTDIGMGAKRLFRGTVLASTQAWEIQKSCISCGHNTSEHSPAMKRFARDLTPTYERACDPAPPTAARARGARGTGKSSPPVLRYVDASVGRLSLRRLCTIYQVEKLAPRGGEFLGGFCFVSDLLGGRG
jgi:hypothetical protein